MQGEGNKGSVVSTIYFGGGTPSVLSADEIKEIIETIYEKFDVVSDAEITLEANPDDLTKEKIRELKTSAINRFSIGIQSFRDEDLLYMNRAHNSTQAEYCVKAAQDAGFENITIDLIYGTPTMNNLQWNENLTKAFALQVPHISAYSLTVELKTALASFILKGKSKNVDEQQSAEQFEILMNRAEEAGFIQYEISNFAKNNKISKHNSSYWKGIPYYGFGPSAHSFDGEKRYKNIANNSIYIKNIEEGKSISEAEELSISEKYNEYVLTSLRTIWGTNKKQIQQKFGVDFLKYFDSEMEPYLKSRHVEVKEDVVTLTKKGKLIADKITSDVFWVN